MSEKILSTITKKKIPINFFKTLHNVYKKDLLNLLITFKGISLQNISSYVAKLIIACIVGSTLFISHSLDKLHSIKFVIFFHLHGHPKLYFLKK